MIGDDRINRTRIIVFDFGYTLYKLGLYDLFSYTALNNMCHRMNERLHREV